MNTIKRFIIGAMPYILLWSFDHFFLNLSVPQYLVVLGILLATDIFSYATGFRRAMYLAINSEAERHQMFMDYLRQHYDVTQKADR